MTTGDFATKPRFPLSLVDYLGRSLRLTEERWIHVLSHSEHDEGTLRRIEETVRDPDCAVQSRTDHTVTLLYRWYDRTPVMSKYLCVVAKTKTADPFIITAYFTDAIKRGETLWSRPNAP